MNFKVIQKQLIQNSESQETPFTPSKFKIKSKGHRTQNMSMSQVLQTFNKQAKKDVLKKRKADLDITQEEIEKRNRFNQLKKRAQRRLKETQSANLDENSVHVDSEMITSFMDFNHKIMNQEETRNNTLKEDGEDTSLRIQGITKSSKFTLNKSSNRNMQTTEESFAFSRNNAHFVQIQGIGIAPTPPRTAKHIPTL